MVATMNQSKLLDRLEDAILWGRADVVLRELDHIRDVDAISETGASLLVTACLHGKVEIVRALLKRGANVNMSCPDGDFPLRAAVGSPEIVAALIEAGADLEKCIVEGDARDGTVFVFAAAVDHSGSSVETLKLLVEKGANIDARAINDSAALSLAVCASGNWCRPPVIETLLELGVDMNCRDRWGYTALMYAIAEHDFDLLEGELERADILQVIELLRGAGASEIGVENVTLAYAIANGDKAKICDLLAVGADINMASSLGETPITWPVRLQNYEMVDFLLGIGADPSAPARSTDFETPLIAAVKNDDLKMVRKLVEAGANLHTEGPFGTALDYARPGAPEVLQYLKGAGAKTAMLLARGLATEDRNQSAILVYSGIAEVSNELAGLLERGQVKVNAHGKSVKPHDECYVVYQLDGHSWTLVHPARAKRGSGHFGPKMARVLSKALSTRAIYYENDDTAGYSGYELYDSDREVERLYQGAAEHLPVFRWEPGPYPGEDDENDEELTLFESKRRQVQPTEIGPDFIHEFFVAEDAYVPPWSERELEITGKSKRYFSKLDRDLFVRVDFVTL